MWKAELGDEGTGRKRDGDQGPPIAGGGGGGGGEGGGEPPLVSSVVGDMGRGGSWLAS